MLKMIKHVKESKRWHWNKMTINWEKELKEFLEMENIVII